MEQYLFETKYNNHFFFFMSLKKLKKKLNILGRIKCKSGKKKKNETKLALIITLFKIINNRK